MLKNKMEMEEIKKHCTFQPKLKRASSAARFDLNSGNPGYSMDQIDENMDGDPGFRDARFANFGINHRIRPSSAMGRDEASRIPIQERLIAEVNKRKENREKLKKNLEIEQMKECSFQPKLSDYKIIPRYPKMNQPGALQS